MERSEALKNAEFNKSQEEISCRNLLLVSHLSACSNQATKLKYRKIFVCFYSNEQPENRQ